jgi:large subunit ribosomal protein L18
MDKSKHKTTRRTRRHGNIRKRIEGTNERPRLAVYKSLKHIHAQVIDDLAGRTLASASSVEDAAGPGAAAAKTGNKASAAAVGKLLAQRASAAGVKQVVFDRGGFKFHGRVKALADAAREAGLQF